MSPENENLRRAAYVKSLLPSNLSPGQCTQCSICFSSMFSEESPGCQITPVGLATSPGHELWCFLEEHQRPMFGGGEEEEKGTDTQPYRTKRNDLKIIPSYLILAILHLPKAPFYQLCGRRKCPSHLFVDAYN